MHTNIYWVPKSRLKMRKMYSHLQNHRITLIVLLSESTVTAFFKISLR
jgi:hypothetical protein